MKIQKKLSGASFQYKKKTKQSKTAKVQNRKAQKKFKNPAKYANRCKKCKNAKFTKYKNKKLSGASYQMQKHKKSKRSKKIKIALARQLLLLRTCSSIFTFVKKISCWDSVFVYFQMKMNLVIGIRWKLLFLYASAAAVFFYLLKYNLDFISSSGERQGFQTPLTQ